MSLRKASTFSTILRTTSISIGAVAAVGGFAMATSQNKGITIGATNSAGIGLIIVSLPFLVTPVTIKKHPLKKWTYEIANE